MDESDFLKEGIELLDPSLDEVLIPFDDLATAEKAAEMLPAFIVHAEDEGSCEPVELGEDDGLEVEL